jgi:hypothetical protein
MKSYFGTILFCFLFQLCFAQVEKQIGPSFILKPRVNFQGFLSQKGEKLFAVELENKGLASSWIIFLSEYSVLSKRPVRRTNITPKEKKGVDRDVRQIFSLKSGFVLLIEEHLEDSIDRLCLQFLNAELTLIKEQFINLSNASEITDLNYELIVNDEESAFGIVHQTRSKNGNDAEIELSVFDDVSNLIFEKKIIVPGSKSRMSFQNWMLDRQNRLFFIGKDLASSLRDTDYRQKTKNGIHLYAYNPSADRLKEFDLNLNDRQIQTVILKESKEGCMLAGWHSKSSSLGKEGYYSILIDTNLNLVSHFIHDFSELDLGKMNGKEFSNLGKIRQNHLLKDLVRLDSSWVLLSEAYRMEREHVSNGAANSESLAEVFYYEDILCFWMDSLGRHQEIKRIEKTQMSVNDKGLYSSFALLPNGDDLTVVFNDHHANLSRRTGNKEIKTASMNQKIAPLMVTWRKGESGIFQSLTSGSGRERLRINLSETLDDKRIHFLLRKGRKARVAEIQIRAN